MSRLPRPAEPFQPDEGRRAAPVESLYPFLYEGTIDPEQVMVEARKSTEAKAREIIDLRVQVCARSSELLISCAKDMAGRFGAGGRLLTFGNGGSATDAQELAALFMYPHDSAAPLPAIGLSSDVSVVTSLANDIGVEVVFSRQISALGRSADIALGLSTSGNSENLLRAFDTAQRMGLMTVGLSGYDGGKMAEITTLDYLFVAPSASIHRIQEAQTTIYHILWELVVAEMAASASATP